MHTTDAPFLIIVPVKQLDQAKTRLGQSPGFDPSLRARLACAFALDTALAASNSPLIGHLWVASNDEAVLTATRSRGIDTLRLDASAGLNNDLSQAAAIGQQRHPDLTPVALCADLPALRTTDLTAALGACHLGEPAFVADADGVGTTLYTAPHSQFWPQFGVDSRAVHIRQGCREIPGTLASLRRDADDMESLAIAIGLGVGPATRDVLSVGGSAAVGEVSVQSK